MGPWITRMPTANRRPVRAPQRSALGPFVHRRWQLLLRPRQIVGDGCTNQGLQRGRINVVAVVEIDGSRGFGVRAGVEQAFRIFDRLKLATTTGLLLGLGGPLTEKSCRNGEREPTPRMSHHAPIAFSRSVAE